MSVTTLVIIGAGDHGRTALEILRAARECDEHTPDVIGFLDDDESKHGRIIGGLPVLGGVSWLSSNGTRVRSALLGLADCKAKSALVNRLASLQLEYVNAIHPRAIIHRSVRFGAGLIIHAGVAISYDTVIGDHVTINLNATIGHDCVVGSLCTLAPGANVAGKVRIGDGCDIGPNATVSKGTIIDEWSLVGPGTVVIKDVPPRVRVFGNPSRIVQTFS